MLGGERCGVGDKCARATMGKRVVLGKGKLGGERCVRGREDFRKLLK